MIFKHNLFNEQSQYIFQGSCPNGDNPYYTVNGMNCSAAAASQSWVCYDTAIHDNCCESCPLFNKGITGTVYIYIGISYQD